MIDHFYENTRAYCIDDFPANSSYILIMELKLGLPTVPVKKEKPL